MYAMTDVHVLRVFTDKKGGFGNPVGIILDEKMQINDRKRQAIAAKLGFSESVFINDLSTSKVNIYNPQREVPFAGHALVGTAWLIAKLRKKPIDSLQCTGGNITVWEKSGLTWIRASMDMTPPWVFEQLASSEKVGSLSASQVASKKHTVVWAWLNESRGIIRARTFASDWGIPEDEANGSGSMQLAVQLARDIEVRHGKGSIIYAKPADIGFAAVGGRVAEDQEQTI